MPIGQISGRHRLPPAGPNDGLPPGCTEDRLRVAQSEVWVCSAATEPDSRWNIVAGSPAYLLTKGCVMA